MDRHRRHAIAIFAALMVAVLAVVLISRVPHFLVLRSLPKLKAIAVTKSVVVPQTGEILLLGHGLGIIAKRSDAPDEKIRGLKNFTEIEFDNHRIAIGPAHEVKQGLSFDQIIAVYSVSSDRFSWWMGYRELHDFSRTATAAYLYRNSSAEQLHRVQLGELEILVVASPSAADIHVRSLMTQKRWGFLVIAQNWKPSNADILNFASRVRVQTENPAAP
ncbi:MAG: hypothetical protein Q8K78_03180 [Planctomycetaceae bacterium]|nr:hypothetical protein [Planctomycetaceae bacterium]